MNTSTTTWPQYRDMTAEQMAAWGEAERKARIEDLKVRGPVGLVEAQEKAEQRRRAIGATRDQSARMVSDAGRAARRREAAGCICNAGVQHYGNCKLATPANVITGPGE